MAMSSRHIIRWAWRTRGETRSRVIALAGERPDLTIVRLGDRADVERWVEGSVSCFGPHDLMRPRVHVAR